MLAMGATLLAGLATAPGADAAFTRDDAPRTVNDGQLVLDNVPPIPADLAARLERYQQLTAREMVGWSADGETLYIRGEEDGVTQLKALDGPGDAPRRLTALDEPVREVAPQPGGGLLAFTLSRGGDAFEQIHLLDPATGHVRALTDTPRALNNRMVWDQDGRRLAFRSTRRNSAANDLWLLDVADPGRVRMILAAPDGALWKPVAFTRDGRRLLVQQYLGITDSRIHLLDLDSGALRRLVGGGEPSTSNVAMGFDATEEGVLFISNQRGRAAEIGRVPIEGAGPPRWMDDPIPWDVTGFDLSRDGRRGAFVTNEHGASRLYLFDPKRLTYRPVRHLPLGVIDDLRFSPDGRRLGFTLSTPRTPGQATVVRTSRLAGLFTGPRAWTRSEVDGLDSSSMVMPRLFTYPARDATAERPFNVPAYAYLPEREGPLPVVIYIHGGPESQFRPRFNASVQMWAAELGVAVLAPNVRGSLGYGRTYLSLDDGRRRENAVHDIGALLDWIAEQPELDQDRVAVYGASYGGYMVLASAVHYSDRLVAGVNRAGISHFVTYLENTGGFRRDLRRFEYGDERDPDMRAFLDAISPLNNVERIRIPLLIAQGANDPVVPAGEAEQMVRALRNAGQDVWAVTALNEGHSFRRQENRAVYQQVVALFLRRHLLGD